MQNLSPGDLIDIVAPASAVSSLVLRQGVDYLKNRGYRVRHSPQILKPYLFHANTDEQRFVQLKQALLNHESKAIWCIRGGYGSNRLIDNLSQLPKPKNKKVFIGISDVCSIHEFLNQKWKWPSLHASLLDRFAKGTIPKACELETWDLLEGRKEIVQFKKLKALNNAAKRVKILKAQITGGNLITLESHWGTRHEMKLNRKFLFIEEIGERGYRIDRALYHLNQTGLLNQCEAVLFGNFKDCGEPNGGKSLAPKVIARFAQEVSIPVFSGVESGHEEWLRPLPFGTKSEIKSSASGFVLNCSWSGL